jgi:hypothetical protein
MESMADLMKNHFAIVIGKSDVWNFVRSLRKSLGNLTFSRLTIVAFFARCNDCLDRCGFTPLTPQQFREPLLLHRRLSKNIAR